MANFLNQIPVPLLLLFFSLLIGDILLGAARAFKEHKFELQRVGDVFLDKGMPFGVTFLVLTVVKVAAVGSAYEMWASTAYFTATAAVIASLVGSIALNLKAITGVDIVLSATGAPGIAFGTPTPTEEPAPTTGSAAVDKIIAERAIREAVQGPTTPPSTVDPTYASVMTDLSTPQL